jgi:SAM-dependent methyltransferase
MRRRPTVGTPLARLGDHLAPEKSPMPAALPAYARRLDLLHESLREDFTAIVQQVPNRAGAHVIDVGCGDGFFTELLATGGAELAWAIDSDPAFLAAAGARLQQHIAAGRVRLVESDARRLPFDDASVDVVWSAHSMQSYDRIPDILAEFYRVLRPGGVLAVLESDSIHSVMLPWPPRLELAVREAERRALEGADDRLGAYFPRYAPRLIAEVGFQDIAVRPRLIHQPGPLKPRLREYVQLYLNDLIDRVGDALNHDHAAMARAFADAYGGTNRQGVDLSVASLQMLITAVRAAGPAPPE